MSEKRKTRAELEAALAEADARLETRALNLTKALNELEGERSDSRELHKSIDELKTRLAIAEAENQRMRGYLARVQEDDVVREELIAVGDPSGETRLVPKRKPTLFHEPSPYGHQGCDHTVMEYARGATRAPPKHWVTY